MDFRGMGYKVVTGGIVLASAGGLMIAAKNVMPRIIAALPNEWLIVIRGGEQRLAGVGLKTWVWPLESFVTFPSTLTKVSFEAMQTTAEMQGVKVAGFAVFSVLRTEDGPFRYYKYVQGAGKEMAEDNLKGMAESLFRKHVATTNLNAVLRDREALRNAVRDEMMKTTKGWGVWLETLEIKDVQICSTSLFEDLQAEFRQDTHLRAEQVRLQSEQKLAEGRAAHDKKMALINSETAVEKAKAQADERTKREKLQGDAELAREKANAELAAEKLKVEQQQLETERALKSAKQEMQHKLKEQESEYSRERALAEHTHQLKMREAEMELDGKMSSSALKKHLIDNTLQIYKTLPLTELKLNNFVAPESVSSGGLAALLPGLGALSSAMKEG